LIDLTQIVARISTDKAVFHQSMSRRSQSRLLSQTAAAGVEKELNTYVK
jgi:hypothetical protein